MNLSLLLFLIGILGFILNRKNIILMIIAIEIMLLAVNNLQFEYVFLFINSTSNINLLDNPNIFNIYFFVENIAKEYQDSTCSFLSCGSIPSFQDVQLDILTTIALNPWHITVLPMVMVTSPSVLLKIKIKPGG